MIALIFDGESGQQKLGDVWVCLANNLNCFMLNDSVSNMIFQFLSRSLSIVYVFTNT